MGRFSVFISEEGGDLCLKCLVLSYLRVGHCQVGHHLTGSRKIWLSADLLVAR